MSNNGVPSCDEAMRILSEGGEYRPKCERCHQSLRPERQHLKYCRKCGQADVDAYLKGEL